MEINGEPNLLDEARWELDWIVRLQASDGGVYHKVASEGWFGDFTHMRNILVKP